jgi:hemin uptake protein HemP
MTSNTQRECLRETNSDRERDPSARSATPVRRYRTSDLFGDCPWIVIEHGSVEYRLHVTRLGKLILTK